jgi:hypothetical protein
VLLRGAGRLLEDCPLPHPRRDQQRRRSEPQALEIEGVVLLVAALSLALGGDVDIARCLQESGLFFECFPYVCPEPVLVKR